MRETHSALDENVSAFETKNVKKTKSVNSYWARKLNIHKTIGHKKTVPSEKLYVAPTLMAFLNRLVSSDLKQKLNTLEYKIQIKITQKKRQFWVF
jgi:hypothetical protein